MSDVAQCIIGVLSCCIAGFLGWCVTWFFCCIASQVDEDAERWKHG